jgi:hypothetical protein
MRQIVQLEPEILFGLRTEDLIQFAEPASVRIDFEELVAEQRL